MPNTEIKANTTSRATVDREGLAPLVAALPDAIDQAMQTTLPHRYTPALAAQIAATAIGMLTGTICPEFPGLCTETETGHDDHSNHEHTVTTGDGSRLLDVGFINLSDGSGPLVYLSGASTEDLHPDKVHARTAELRRLLDEADAIADTIQRMQGTAVPAPSERAFTHARTAIDAAVEASADPKGTARALRTYADMTETEQA